ncbi:hypothetical protein, partial [Rhodoblastus sp.]|uniref:hypothetical protein n=1 Tax=Rhodoblastus sp. TaxID=1962975 RepID=UPI0035AEB598
MSEADQVRSLRRILSRTLDNISRKRTHSSRSDAQPRLIRRAERASSAETPIAASTCEGVTLPEEQAEPEDKATPSTS